MSFVTDLRNVSEKSVEQVAARFPDLPRPLLAAIGAGDIAVERLAELRESIRESLPATPGAPSTADVRAMTTELPAKAQKAAADVAGSLEHFASEAPGKAQELISELPGRVTEIAQALSPETVRDTVEAYTQLAGVIYGNLADRGDKTWSKVRSAGLRPGTVVDEATPKRRTTKPAAGKATTTKATRPATKVTKPAAKVAGHPAPRAKAAHPAPAHVAHETATQDAHHAAGHAKAAAHETTHEAKATPAAGNGAVTEADKG